MQEYMGCLNWHGVGSRWKHFLEWLVKQDAELLHKRFAWCWRVRRGSFMEEVVVPHSARRHTLISGLCPLPSFLLFSNLLSFRDLKDVFTRFAHHLGRVTSFRALSLTPDGFATILRANAVYPSGR